MVGIMPILRRFTFLNSLVRGLVKLAGESTLLLKTRPHWPRAVDEFIYLLAEIWAHLTAGANSALLTVR